MAISDKANRGEWAEAYVFLKVLGEGKINAGDVNGNEVNDVYIKVNSVIRKQNDDIYEFTRHISEDGVKIICTVNDIEIQRLPVSVFVENSDNLFQKIRNKTGNKGTVSVPEVATFLRSLGLTSLKSSSSPDKSNNSFGGKVDIVLKTISITDGMREKIGFSIKSYITSHATLFNCSEASNIVYRINGCNEEHMHAINHIMISDGKVDLKGRMKYIKDSIDLSLEFVGSKNINTKYGEVNSVGPYFEWNLDLLDNRIINVLGEALLAVYGYSKKDVKSSVINIISYLEQNNPLTVHCPELFYKAKFRDFLYASFAGMSAAKKWDGQYKVNGGYIGVKKDGEILYFRALSTHEFSTYLVNNTKIEKPDTGALAKLAFDEARQVLEGTEPDINILNLSKESRNKKGNFGYVYYNCDDNQYYININFSIRFK